MKNITIKFIITIIVGISFSPVLSQNMPDDITGVWLTPENRSAIQIVKIDNCYYGKIVWQKEPNDENGNPKKDINNPVPSLRNKTIQGLIIMKDLCFNGEKEWVKGNIYNPESGNNYKIKVELVNQSTLKVRGYIGFSIIGKTSVWKRR